MTKIEAVTEELIAELLDLDIDTIEEVRREWLSDIATKGISERVISYCNTIVDHVIATKEYSNLATN